MALKAVHYPLVPSSLCSSCRHRLLRPLFQHSFSTSPLRRADENDNGDELKPVADDVDGMEAFSQALRKPGRQQRAPPPQPMSQTLQRLSQTASESTDKNSLLTPPDEPYHLTLYSHRHNSHLTFTTPSRTPILSFSCGNLGFKKAARGTFDAAYQLTTYTFAKMLEKSWRLGGQKSTGSVLTMRDVDRIEVMMRGYGPGREAFQKALLGGEGRAVKGKVVRVVDGTRLKFGGTRSKNVRRL